MIANFLSFSPSDGENICNLSYKKAQLNLGQSFVQKESVSERAFVRDGRFLIVIVRFGSYANRILSRMDSSKSLRGGFIDLSNIHSARLSVTSSTFLIPQPTKDSRR